MVTAVVTLPTGDGGGKPAIGCRRSARTVAGRESFHTPPGSAGLLHLVPYPWTIGNVSRPSVERFGRARTLEPTTTSKRQLGMKCLAVSLVILSGCSSAAVIPTGAPTTAPTITTSTTTTSTETTVGTTTTIVSTTTTLAAPVTSPTPTLADGRPTTFLAVTVDYAAVEVDTLTGEVVRFLGQAGNARDLADAECAACVNVIDRVWRTNGGEHVYISECCEPAAGSITILTGDVAVVTSESQANFFAWSVVPSPTQDLIIAVGYDTAVSDPIGRPLINLFQNDGNGVPGIGWSNDGDTVYWLDIPWQHTPTPGVATFTGFELATGSTETFEVDWLAQDSVLEGLAGQASGSLVSFRTGADGSTEGVVISPTGDLVATFGVEDGSRLGGYDPTGRFLIYVDGAGVARWQGLGKSGVLGHGYLMASW